MSVWGVNECLGCLRVVMGVWGYLVTPAYSDLVPVIYKRINFLISFDQFRANVKSVLKVGVYLQRLMRDKARHNKGQK